MNNILVIEDEHDVRLGILKALNYEGYRTLEAANGQQGIDLARTHRPDLIICDIMMPERSGYSVLVELRRDPRTAMIPFIFLTAMTGRKDVADGIQLGADAYVTKPFIMEKLLGIIKTALAQQTSDLSRHLNRLRVGLAHTLPPKIQAPLTGILGFSGLLAHSGANALPQPNDFHEIQTAIYDHARRLQRVMSNYLLYYELQLLQYEPEMRDLWLLPGQETDRDTLLAVARNKADEFRRPEDLTTSLMDAAIPMSPGILHKLLEELLDNAFQFSKPGTPVQLESRQTPDEIGIYVHDRGCGMTPEQIESPERASGLGLQVCRLLAQLGAGTLTIQSEQHHGTTVAVVFHARHEDK